VRIHDAHRAARLQGMEPCPYVSFQQRGSPGYRAGLYAWRCVVAVNGTPTPDLDALLAVDATLKDGDDVRVDVITLEGRKQVLTLEPYRDFWPTVEVKWDGKVWTRTVHTP
jgi:pro-apoptotic serine protease NMA111